jgi:hypothetical protein
LFLACGLVEETRKAGREIDEQNGEKEEEEAEDDHKIGWGAGG